MIINVIIVEIYLNWFDIIAKYVKTMIYVKNAIQL